MLPLPSFSLTTPKNMDELQSLLMSADQYTKIMAGGTDLMPNLKHGLYDVKNIISLKKIKELKNYESGHDVMKLGALLSLSAIASHQDIRKKLPVLTRASLQIASPQIRNMGTIGGNICLDTRCLYFNQTAFWRSALGFCLKKDGHCCHVIKTGKRCVAAASNDLATVLLALDAKLTLLAHTQSKTLALDDFYSADGEKNTIKAPNEVLTSITIPLDQNKKTGFYKLRHRKSIDFPLLSVAVAFAIQDQRLEKAKLVINALVAKPKVMDLAEFNGAFYNQSVINDIATMAQKKCHPQSNLADDKMWRKDMIGEAVKLAFNDALN